MPRRKLSPQQAQLKEMTLKALEESVVDAVRANEEVALMTELALSNHATPSEVKVRARQAWQRARGQQEVDGTPSPDRARTR